MAKYKISIMWEGSNEIIEDCESEEEAIDLGYNFYADGCALCNVSVELIEEDEEEEDYEED